MVYRVNRASGTCFILKISNIFLLLTFMWNDCVEGHIPKWYLKFRWHHEEWFNGTVLTFKGQHNIAWMGNLQIFPLFCNHARMWIMSFRDSSSDMFVHKVPQSVRWDVTEKSLLKLLHNGGLLFAYWAIFISPLNEAS